MRINGHIIKAGALLTAALVCAILCGCGRGGNDSRPALTIWVYSDEYKRQIINAFDADFSSASWRLDVTVVKAEELDEHMRVAAEKDALPDIFMLSPDNLAEYVESGIAADISDMGIELNPSSYYRYTIDSGRDSGGVQRAVCWQPDPGLFFYRRSIAKTYLGTDSPEEVGEMLSTWDGFLSAARTIREQSRGKTSMIVGLEDVMRAYLGADKVGWVKDGKLNMSEEAAAFLDFAKTLADEELVYEAEQWSASWVAGMSDPQSVFGYFSSGLGMKNVLKKACGGTVAGDGSFADWACVAGPSPYNWGGCWLAVSGSSDMKKQAAAMLEYFICEEEAMERNCLIEGAFSSNRNVVETIKFDPQFGDPFLAGQNYYAVQAQAAGDISMARVSKYTSLIDRAYIDCVAAYAFDGARRDDALSDFVRRVQNAYPELF